MPRKLNDTDTASIRKAVLKGGMSHRAAAAHFGVSLRQVQRSVSPLKRRMQDISYYTRNKHRYKLWAAQAYQRRKQRETEEELLNSPSS